MIGGTRMAPLLLFVVAAALPVTNLLYEDCLLPCASAFLVRNFDARRQRWTTSQTTVPAAILHKSNNCATSLLAAVSNKNHNKKKQKKSNDKDSISFFDEAFLSCRAGSGGQGSSTYKKAKKGANGIPDGGSGGTGGNVYLVLDTSLNTLAGFAAASGSSNKNKKVYRASDGTAGGRMYDNGKQGESIEIAVPSGTFIEKRLKQEQQSDPDSENGTNNLTKDEDEWISIGTIDSQTPRLLVAKGGLGGEGTATLKGKKPGAARRGPQGGETSFLKLTLKIVADIALVGVPNAGKSTFLASVTRAKPKIADYPFTTVVPNLGTWIPPSTNAMETKRKTTAANDVGSSNNNNNGLVLCDVPGLIEGASEGVGLGHAFLRHIEKCSVILHLVDATSEDPIRDYKMVQEELERYGVNVEDNDVDDNSNDANDDSTTSNPVGSLAQKPQVVVLNKMDAAFADNDGDLEEQRKDLADRLKEEMGHTRLLWVSAKEKTGVDDLMTRMSSYVGNMKEQQKEQELQEDSDQ